MRSSFCFALAASLCRRSARAGAAMLRRGGAEKTGDAGAVGGCQAERSLASWGSAGICRAALPCRGRGEGGRALPTVPHTAGECENSLSKAVFLAVDLLFAP